MGGERRFKRTTIRELESRIMQASTEAKFEAIMPALKHDRSSGQGQCLKKMTTSLGLAMSITLIFCSRIFVGVRDNDELSIHPLR